MTVQSADLKKLSIYTVEPTESLEVEAMFNPKEIQVDKSVPWTKGKNSKADQPDLEFSSAEGRSMSFELMFDTYETATNVHTHVEKLIKMAMVQNADSTDENKKRPPKVKVSLGNKALPDFVGVIESISTKYTMFLPDGTPVRATCNVKIKEANKLSFKKK